MDFFGILFDVKNGTKVPYSKTYFDTLFAAKLAEMQIKIITGTLPLTFRTSERALRSWTIYGNNTPHIATSTGVLPLTFTTTEDKLRDWEIMGNDEPGTENILNISDTWITAGQTTYSVDGQTFTVTGNWYVYMVIPVERNTNYYLDFNTVSSTTYQAAAVFGVLNGVLHNNDVLVNRQGVPFIFTTGEREQIAVIFYSGVNAVGTSVYDNIMLVKGSTAPDHYIPYQQGVGEQRVDGYYAPLTISQQGQTDKTVDIYIGDSPLTEGETVSKTSTGVDIELFEGSNTITTSLYNKPEMSIEGVDYVGVGEPINDSWQIPLTVSDGTNTATVNVPINAPLTDGQSVTDTLTISTFEGENTIDTTLTNKPQMTITYKGG